ncbi:hypothetical protein [Comamonas sp. JC664]|uniref:hypothetical protein n=1 Tax=Comamonas sp. JC664 TaxID=2801917 RepID=UPI00174B670D|nr:hypothetical protein [Comamonas sp. JC664]MBL0693515.1 hypothetical protein [Comamonas sp. JC664]GHG72954.1 hypothetical protein GCM10012319_19350 [Comamonas sp. KCTC 72670]
MSDAGRHLDARSWRALRDKSPDAVAYFADHLSRPCEVCEAFLERADGEDAFGLEAMTDEALGTLAPVREDAVGWARLRKRLGSPRRVWRPGAVAVAMAAAAAMVVFAVHPALLTGEQPGTSVRLKGGGALALELTALARLPDGALRPLTDGASLPPEAVVLIRYRSSELAHALLALESPDGSVQMLGAYTLEAGTHDLREGDALAGVSLEGEHGPKTLVLAAWPRGQGAEEARDAALAQGRVPEGATLSRLGLRVTPEDAR